MRIYNKAKATPTHYFPSVLLPVRTPWLYKAYVLCKRRRTSRSPALSPSLSVILFIALYIPLALSSSVYFSVSRSYSTSLPLYRPLSLSFLFLCLCISHFIPMHIYLRRTLCPAVSLYSSLALRLLLSVSPSLSLPP